MIGLLPELARESWHKSQRMSVELADSKMIERRLHSYHFCQRCHLFSTGIVLIDSLRSTKAPHAGKRMNLPKPPKTTTLLFFSSISDLQRYDVIDSCIVVSLTAALRKYNNNLLSHAAAATSPTITTKKALHLMCRNGF